jgi:hypothetical protein
MPDCVIGCLAGYGWDDVAVWARSLAASGFAGRKVALVRQPGAGVADALTASGFEVVDFSGAPTGASAYVARFTDLHRYLHDQRRRGVTFRWVVATDVRDVCFQRDPLGFLSRLDPPRLVLSQEGLTYEHAQWNAQNLQAAFGPEALETLSWAAPSNAGVLAGPHYTIEGLALLIATLARAASAEVADQAALNLLAEGLSGSLWFHRSGSAEPWACEAGVMADPRRIERNRPNLLGPEPQWRDGWVLTASGEPYAIVHQYDRVPIWYLAITARYGR